MKKISKIMIIVFVAQIFLFPFSQAVCQENIEKKVNKYLEWMKRTESRIWPAASRLESLGEKTIPTIKRELKFLPENAQVACSKVLINLGEEDYALRHLMIIIEKGKDLSSRISAVSIVGIHGDFELEDQLSQIMEQAYNPAFKIALAKSLWQVARNPQAANVLKSFLEVENEEIQFAAALALAETNNVEAAKPVLSLIKEEPSMRGRLARSLLEQDTLVNRYERLLDSHVVQQKVVEKEKSKYPTIEEVMSKVKQYHVKGDKFTEQDLIDAAIKGMVLHSDIHSAFWTKKEWEDFVTSIVDEAYVGIGVYVGERNGYFTVIAPIYSGPAYKSGVRSMDKIIAVNGWNTTGKSTEEIIKKIRGVQGSSVKLKIARDGWAKMREIEIKREKIQIPTLYYQLLPAKIGYIRLTQFGRKTSSNMDAALKDMAKRGMKGVILDLRGNAGGWLTAAVDIVDKFISERKLVVYSQGRHPVKGSKYSYFTSSGGYGTLPLVVLVDESSASASEIVAGTLQHYKRAQIIGQRSYGKGSVQEPLELDTRRGARLKLTIAYYYLPDGRCIHNEMDKDGNVTKHNGIAPDIEVKEEDWEPWKNEELAKLQEAKKFKEYIEKYFSLHKDLFHKLADNDGLSTEKYPEFQSWYKSLETKAGPNDVRRWLRLHLRRKASDDKGKEYACDYVEDKVLQKAIIEVCSQMQVKPDTISEYKIIK